MSVAERADGNDASSTRQPPPYTPSEHVPSPYSPLQSAENSSPLVIVNYNISQPPPQGPTAPLDNSPPPQRPTSQVPISQPPIKPPKPSSSVKSPPTALPKPQTAPKPSKIQVQWPPASSGGPLENTKPPPPPKKPIIPLQK